MRLHDNPTLFAASRTQQPLVCVYVFEEKWITGRYLDFERCSSHRLAFWEASVVAMRQQLRQLGGELYVFRGDTSKIVPAVAKAVNATSVYAQHEFGPEEMEMEQQIARQTDLRLHWGNMLFAPGTLDLDTEKSPFYFTAFRNKVLSLKNQFIESLDVPQLRFQHIQHTIHAYEPKLVPNQPFKAGETEALTALNNYVTPKYLTNYHATRELFEGDGFSTHWSPYLAQGSLSATRAYRLLTEAQTGDGTLSVSIEKLKDQLIWRDYYRWLFLRYGKRIFRPTGLRTVTPTMYDDRAAFDAWRQGKTGNELVDSLMREMNATGFMSNRGRMIASYYLSKELKTNWMWGAQWFEAQLIDYDVCNNYGNWAYQSGTGTDSRINRRFNIVKQADKYDPKGSFRQKWGSGQGRLF